MSEHAAAAWAAEVAEPWRLEPALIRELGPPLNLEGNRGHLFHATLAGLRAAARGREVVPR